MPRVGAAARPAFLVPATATTFGKIPSATTSAANRGRRGARLFRDNGFIQGGAEDRTSDVIC